MGIGDGQECHNWLPEAGQHLWDGEMTAIPKTRLQCPCGEFLQGANEDDLVEQAQRHLRERHPNLEYDREDILFMAY